MTTKRRHPARTGHGDESTDGKRRRFYVRRPSPSGMGGAIFGGTTGAFVAGPLGAAVGLALGGAAGETLEHLLPSENGDDSGSADG